MGLQTTPERVCQKLCKSSVFLNRRFLLWHKKTCLLVPRKHVFLCHKKTCLLVSPEDMFSCVTRRHVFLWHKKTCLLVTQEDMSSCDARRHACLASTYAWPYLIDMLAWPVHCTYAVCSGWLHIAAKHHRQQEERTN